MTWPYARKSREASAKSSRLLIIFCYGSASHIMPASAALEFDLCKHIYYSRDGRDRRQVCLVELYRFGVRATGICDASATYVVLS